MLPLLRAALPLLLSIGTGIVAQLFCTLLLGHESPAQLAAFALAGAVLHPVNAAVSGALRGLSPFVAPFREDPATALPYLRDARWLAIALGTAGAAILLCTPWIVSGAAPEVRAELGPLPVLLAANVLLSSVGGGANGALIAFGRRRQVLWSSLAATAAEVLVLLLLVPRLGVTGAGLALLTSTAVALTVSRTLLHRVLGLSFHPGRPRPREIWRMARVGLPLSATLIVKFAAMAVVAYAAARLGARAAASHSVLLTLDLLLGLLAFATGLASTPEVARAATPSHARRVGGSALAVAAAGVLACGGAALLLPVGRWFSADPVVVELVESTVPLLVAYSLVTGCGMVLTASFAGLRRTGWSLGAALACYGLLVPAVLAAGDLAGMWAVLVGCEVVGLVVKLAGWWRVTSFPASGTTGRSGVRSGPPR
ncbi:polysaccharide biosynthesis C-terminal domain-containing protein [Nonomuraea sp. NPDC050663]|uniref:polysaccharide biosynthesis C-terminal domain-containing protein n=1 Tax=Nonomuraea sp. NPDC050663 TaxID=3364370 RepID=UPI0037BB2532